MAKSPDFAKAASNYCRASPTGAARDGNELLRLRETVTLKFSPLSRVRARRSRSTKVKGVLGGVRVRASQDRADFADSARFSPGSLSASLCV